MLFARYLINILAASLILHFDGSLRAPQDIHSDIVPSSVTSSFLSPIPTCAAALFSADGELLALGGLHLELLPTTTSTETEYEGLIYGLRQLLCLFSDPSFAALISNVDPISIIVKGDCKTVIDQMNGRAKPRKQRIHYNQAMSLVQKISEEFKSSFTFEHVSRNENTICDHACREIVEYIQLKHITSLRNMIKDIAIRKHPLPLLPQSKKKRFHFRETEFSIPLGLLSGWQGGMIPLSIRPSFLIEIACEANRMGDFVALRVVGETLLLESKRWRKYLSSSKVMERNDIETIANQLIHAGLIGLGLEKEAARCASDDISFCNHSITTSLQKTNLPSYPEMEVGCPQLIIEGKTWDISDNFSYSI